MWPWSGFYWLNRKENAECLDFFMWAAFSFTKWDIRHLLISIISICRLFFCFCFFFWFLKSWIVFGNFFFFFLDIVLKICCVPMPFYRWILKGNANLLKIQNEVGLYDKNAPLFFKIKLLIYIRLTFLLSSKPVWDH